MNSEMKSKLKKWILTMIGIALLGAGVALATVPQLGTDPLAGFNEALSRISGISLGRMTSLVELAMILFCFLFYRECIGIGTLLSMFLVQFPIDFVSVMLGKPASLFSGILMILAGTVLIALGAELIMYGKLGMGPYEAFISTIGKLTKMKFSFAKYLCDGSFLVLTALLKGYVGIGTIIIFVLCPKLMEVIENILKHYDL